MSHHKSCVIIRTLRGIHVAKIRKFFYYPIGLLTFLTRKSSPFRTLAALLAKNA